MYLYRQRAKNFDVEWWRHFLGGLEPSHFGAMAQMGVADSCLNLSELYLMCRAANLKVSRGVPSFGMPCVAGLFRAVLQVQSRALAWAIWAEAFVGYGSVWVEALFGLFGFGLVYSIPFSSSQRYRFLYFIIGASKELSRPELGCLQ